MAAQPIVLENLRWYLWRTGMRPMTRRVSDYSLAKSIMLCWRDMEAEAGRTPPSYELCVRVCADYVGV